MSSPSVPLLRRGERGKWRENTQIKINIISPFEGGQRGMID